MDNSWNFDDWKPTALPRSHWQKPRDQEIQAVIPQLPKRTNEITQQPYSPKCWLNRGRVLLYLGYPELATGDFYKAKMLCEAFEYPTDDELVGKVRGCIGVKTNRFYRLANMRPGRGKEPKAGEVDEDILSSIKLEAYNGLAMALEQCLSIGEAIYHCQKGLSWFPDDKLLEARLKRLELRRDRQETGGFIVQRYPWMEDKHVRRAGSVLAGALDHVEGISDRRCTLKESTLAPNTTKKRVRWVDQVFTKPLAASTREIQSSSSQPNAARQSASNSRSVAIPDSDFLGIFARKYIKQRSLILSDITVTGVASIKPKNTCENCYGPLEHARFSRVCCNTEYCSVLCRELATTGYHKETCSRIITTNAAEAQHTGTYDSCHRAYNDVNLGLDLHNMLLMRFLATARAEVKHPLDHEAAARLTNQYDKRREMPFSLISNIITPLRMLRTLKVDIFAEASFDTWVLMTVWHRIHIHMHLQPYRRVGSMLAINPVFSLFNHSCEPNAGWKFNGDCTTVLVYALKDIKEGEEVFVSYVGDMRGKSKLDRLVILKDKVGRCKCTRCLRE